MPLPQISAKPLFPRPCCPRGSWTPSGAEGGSCARARPARTRALTWVHVCGHPATAAAGSRRVGGPGAGVPCRYPLPPVTSFRPPSPPAPQVLSHRGSPSGCGGVGTEGESQAAGRSASPRCTHSSPARPQRMHTSSQTHSGHTDPHTLTPPGTHSLLYPGASPGSFLEGKRGAAGRLAQGPHSSPFPAPGQPGVQGASSGPWRGGACWEGCWAGLARESQRPTRLTSQRGELRPAEL